MDPRKKEYKVHVTEKLYKCLKFPTFLNTFLSTSLPKGFCFLPSELGQGKAVHVEDCTNLGEVQKSLLVSIILTNFFFTTGTFETVPKPESGQFYKYVTFFSPFFKFDQGL